MSKKFIRSEYRFNIEVFKDGSDKEYKVTNMPMDKLNLVLEAIRDKYG